jgi:hypothetical protein
MSSKARSLGNAALGCAALFGAMFSVMGCSSNTPATPRVYIASTVFPGMNGTVNCNFASTTPVIDIGSTTTSVQSGDSQNGDPVQVTCSVTPGANMSFDINLTAQLRGQGSFYAKGNVTNDHSAPQPGITASFNLMGQGFTENAGGAGDGAADPGCSIDFTGDAINQGDPNMGVFPGRIWGNIVCPSAALSDGTKACEGDAQFKFENCVGSPTSN